MLVHHTGVFYFVGMHVTMCVCSCLFPRLTGNVGVRLKCCHTVFCYSLRLLQNQQPAGITMQLGCRQQRRLCFSDLFLLFTGCCAPGSLSAHLLGFMSCVYSVSVWWYVWRVPRMCVFGMWMCVCVCFFTGSGAGRAFWRGPDSCLLLPQGVINSEGGVVIYPFY